MNEIYSVKSYPNLFVYTYYDIEKKNINQYVISMSRNDITGIVDHLGKVENQIGFGNLDLDYYILHFIIDARSYIGKMSNDSILQMINRIVTSIKNGDPQNIDKKYMSQLDLSSFFGFSSPDKDVTLTDIKIALGEYNVNATDFKFGVPEKNTNDVLLEGINDVVAINALYNLSIGKCDFENYKGINLISARYKLCEESYLSGTNYSPTSFAKFYFLKIYRGFGGDSNIQNLLSLAKVNNKSIDLKDFIPHYANYLSPVFNNVVNSVIENSNSAKQTFSCSIGYHGIPLKFGMGGVHGCNYGGKYISDENNIIVDIDIVSMYASIAVALNICPSHMDDAFIKAMKYILNKRVLSLNKTDDISKGIVKTLKTTLNYIYGKTKEENSPFYDPKYSLKVIFAAQFLMAKFMEALVNRIEGIKFIMVNTDSITFISPRDSKDKVIDAISKIREIIPTLLFKVKTYNVLYVKDVNNYIGFNDNGITARGIFDYNIDIFKDNSALIIPKVVRDILICGENASNAIDKYEIDDFLIKAKSNSVLTYGRFESGEKIISQIQNPSRYYYSGDYKTSGYLSTKVNNIFKKITDYCPITIFNDKNENGPDINKKYYLNKIEDIIYEVDHFPDRDVILNFQ